MTYQFRRPAPSTVSGMFSTLLGRDIKIDTRRRIRVGPRDHFTAATFLSESGTLIGMAAFDLPLSCSLGGALSLIPIHVVKKCQESHAMDEMLWENLHEVFNICTRFFHDAFFTEMIALDKVYTNPDDLPRDLLKFLRRATHRHEMGCTVPGYGAGGMMFSAI